MSTTFSLYPFTKEAYEIPLASWHLRESNNDNLKFCIAYLVVAFRIYFSNFLPDSFIALYIVTCHDIHEVLSFHLRKFEKSKMFSVRKSFAFLDNYQDILNNFHAFESSFSILICIAFTTKIPSLLISVFLAHKAQDYAVFIYTAFLSFSYITIIFYIASKVPETDNYAKEINLEILERMLLLTTKAPPSNIWRLHTSPPFTLTAWKFFSFTRDSYLSCVGTLVTYTLLMVNL